MAFQGILFLQVVGWMHCHMPNLSTTDSSCGWEGLPENFNKFMSTIRTGNKTNLFGKLYQSYLIKQF